MSTLAFGTISCPIIRRSEQTLNRCLFFSQGLILDSLVPVFSFGTFPALAVKAGFTALVGFVTVQVYAVVTVNDKY